MAGALVEIRGANRLRSTLRRAGDDLKTLSEAHAAAARIVQGRATQLVPVRTGTLKSTIRSSGTKTSGVVRAGFARVPYAGPIHWGWPRHHIKATPYLSLAAEQTQARWIAAYEDGIEKALNQIRGL